MFELARFPGIIRVQEGNKVSRRMIDPVISRTGCAAVGLGEQPHSLLVGQQGGNQLIRAAVVHDQDLIGGPGLGENTVQGSADGSGCLIRGNDQTDPWMSHIDRTFAREKGDSEGITPADLSWPAG